MILFRWFHRFMAVVILCIFMHGVAVAAPEVPQGSYSDGLESYQLGVDDRLRITVYGEDDLTGSYSVAADGTVSMPLIGAVPVAGLLLPQVEALITAQLKDGYFVDPSVSIEIESYRPFYILGEVGTPGRYEYANHITILNAVALAGGFTYRAKQKTVKVQRPGYTGEGVDARGYITLQPHDLVFPGDVLLVEERFF